VTQRQDSLPTLREKVRCPAGLAFGLLLSMSSATSAFAEPTPQERALGEALFEEGRALMARGNLKEACPKLAESYRLDPGGGTLLNLALCHSREGKIATAWVEFRDSQAIARRDKRLDREEAAAAEMRRLEAMLSRLSIIIPPEAMVPGLSIKLDDTLIAKAAWGTKVPIDPGKHSIVAEAPGRRTFATTVEIGPTAAEPTVTIPPLAAAPRAPGNAPSSPPPVVSASPETNTSPPQLPPRGSGQRMAGYVIGGVGVAGIGIGAGFGVAAIFKQKDSNAICPGTVCRRDQESALELNQDAKTFARVSNIAFGVGAVGVVAGSILILTAPRQKKDATVGVAFYRGGGGVSLDGAF
jgi:hypothetical protein